MAQPGTTESSKLPATLNLARDFIPGPEFLDQLVSNHVPNDVAIEYLQSDNQVQRFSYRWLHSASDSLAWQLSSELTRRSPGRRNTVIPILIPQCPTLYVCYLAILKLGHAFCPLNLDTPPERLKFIVNDVGADIILCLEEVQDEIKGVLHEISCVVPWAAETQRNTFNSIDVRHETTQRKGSDIAYIMYTSGSTGLPKAVVLPHCSVTQAILAHDEHIPSFRKFLQFASPTFDVSVFEIFFPLFRGATLACCERNHMLADLPFAMRILEVDIAELTPSVTASLLQRRSAAPNLRYLLTIGEAMNQHTLNEFGGSAERESMLYALYGPTEASIHCAILPKMQISDGPNNIGKPLRTVTAIILAEDGAEDTEITPRGIKGELALMGQLASGYLNRSVETKAAFAHLPGYGEVYRTGDRAMITEDGHIFMYGRIKEGQVKIRGQRIELGEIEAAACKNEAVELAVAMVIGSSLVLFCSGREIEDEDSIRKSCNTWLAKHMRPSAIILCREGLPRLSSGKVDRQQLKLRYKETTSSSSANGVVMTETDQVLANRFSAECGHSFGLHASFAEHGLDSLKAIVIAAALRDKFPGISVKMILESDSVVKLSENLSMLPTMPVAEQDLDAESDPSFHLEELEKEVRAEAVRAHPYCNVEAVRMCSDIQVGMLAETLQNSTANYNIVKICLAENIAEQDFDDAFLGIASANEILRSSFVQTSSSKSPFAMVVRDRINPMETPSLWDPLTWRHGHESDVPQVTLTIHHAIYDGWSWDLIMQDLNLLLIKRPIAYRPTYEAFRRWKDKQRSSFEEADLTYWESELLSSPPSMLPCLCSELPTVMQYESTHLIAEMKLSALKSLAQSLRISTQAIFQASVSLLISSFVESSDLVTGFVSSGRDAAFPGIDQVIGPCLSTNPLRINVKEVRTVRDLFVSVNRKQMSSLDHAHCSLQLIKRMLKLAPDQELFDVICAWQESPVKLLQRSHPAYVTGTFDGIMYGMLVEAEPDYKNNSIVLKCTSRNDRMPPEHAKILLKQLSAIMSAAIEDPYLTPLNLWGKFNGDLISSSNSDLTLVDVFPNILGTIKDISIAEPERIAVELVDDAGWDDLPLKKRCLSYGELHKRGFDLAARLATEYEVLPDDIVCLCLPKSVELYLLIYAIIEAGAGYLCIDPSNPDWRTNAVLKEANCKLLILQPGHRFIPEYPVAITCDNDLLSKHNSLTNQRRTQASGHHLAYAVSTSGTTGSPKIVLVTRQNLFQNIIALSQIYPHQTQDRLLQSCSPAFDVSVFEIFWTWHCGMTLCAASNDVLFRDLTGFIDRVGITHLSMTPSVAALVDPNKTPNIKFLVCAGEPMSQVVDTRWRNRGLYQGYGPSETTNICTVRSVAGTQTPINNIGKPLPNTSVFICARQSGQVSAAQSGNLPPLLPLGARGEIWIGGAQVGRGYTDSTLTEGSWLNHPIHGRLYRSGDVGHQLYDGSILYTGRIDDQIKIRGLRIELKEVALAVMTTPHIDNACCFKLSTNTKEELVCFCTNKLSTSTNGSMIHGIFENIHQRLPNYMLPDLIVPMSEFPMTTQGKIDGTKLANMYNNIPQKERAKYGRFNFDDRHYTQMTEQELAIAEVVAKIVDLPLEQIDATASFFTMGIDSLRAITLTNLLRNEGFHVEISAVLRYASVSRLALFLQNRSYMNRVHKSDAKPLNQLSESWTNSLSMRFRKMGYEIDDILPCTSLQSAMLASTTAAKSTKYWNTQVYSLNVPVDLIREAWTVIIRRHTIFRTGFVVGESLDEPYCQVVLRDFELPWRQSQTLMMENENNLDVLSGRPPYEFVLVGTNVLQLRIHHAMYDAVALDIVHTEIEAFCHQRELESPVSFREYSRFTIRTDQSELNDFWGHKLRRTEPCRLISGMLSYDSGRTTQIDRIAKSSLPAIEDQARSSQVTMLAILQAALARLLHICLNMRQCCFGTVFGGRNIDIASAEKIVGPCFNTLPTPVSCERRLSNRELSRELHQYNLDILPYQATSLRLLNRQYGNGERAFFDCLLLLQPPPTKLDPSVFSLVSEQGTMDFPFIFEVIPTAEKDELQLNLHSQFDGFDIPDKLLSLFDELIEDCTQYPENLSFDMAHTHIGLRDIFHSLNSEVHANGILADSNGIEAPDQRTNNAGKVVIEVVSNLKQEEQKMINLRSTIYQMGLDSINAIQLVQALRQKGYNISLADVLEHPRLNDIAKICSSTPGINGIESATFDLDAFDERWRPHFVRHFDLSSTDVEAIWPCTPIQCGIIAQTVASQYNLYFSTIVIRLEDKVDLSRLRDAWQQNMQRHVMLRAAIAHSSNSNFPYAMIVYAQHSIDLPWQATGETGSQSNSVDTWPAEVFNVAKAPWRLLIESTKDGQNLRLQIHHALYDAKSLQTILDDVESSYRNNILPSVTSVEAALRQILVMSEDPSKTEDLYQILKETAQVTIFPNLNPDHVSESKVFVKRRCLSFPAQTVSEACKTLDCSFLAMCQATWAELLSDYLGQENVAFGNIVSDRAFEDANLNDAVFPCIRTAPICVRVTSDTADTLSQLQIINAASSRCQHTRQSPLLHKLSPDGPLFDTVLVVQYEANEVDATKLWSVIDEETSAEFSLSIEVMQQKDGSIGLRVTAQSAVLPQEQAVVLLAQFERIMSNILRLRHDPGNQMQPHSSLLSILPAAAAKIQCEATTLYDMFIVSTEKCPNSKAFEFATSVSSEGVELQSWTYTQLKNKSLQVANLLLLNGAQTGDLIGLCFDKCPEASFALLGIQAAGCGYVAIDPAAPPDRKNFVLKDAQCKILLATSSSAWNISDNTNLQILLLDDDRILLNLSEAAPFLSRPVLSEDICYCLYTSGTTGQPKGCLITHGSAVQAMLSFQRIFAGRWDEGSRWLQFAGFHFDVSVLEHFWSWSVGICVTSIPRDLLFEDLGGTITALQITHLDLTPSLARLISPQEVPKLCKGVFIVGGEQVRQDIYDVWASSGCLYNFYGPSEVTIGCTFRKVTTVAKPSNIGQQWDNVSTFVLNPQSEDVVHRGAVGELCLGGVLVGQGYVNRPELTGQKFVTLQAFDKRVYRTGDLVRLLHDNSFEFLGRIDDQVKLRGQRLEIGEINHVLIRSHPGIRDVATLVISHPQQATEQLIAFFATVEGKPPVQTQPQVQIDDNWHELPIAAKNNAEQKLPAYMVPAHFVVLDYLPLTLNNKVDAKALKQIYRALSFSSLRNSKSQQTGRAQESLLWPKLTSTIGAYTGIAQDAIHPSTSVFELGVDSVSVVGLARVLKEAGLPGVSIPALLTSHSLQGLIEALEQNKNEVLSQQDKKPNSETGAFHSKDEFCAAISQQLNISPYEIEVIAPCTPLQEGMVTKVLMDESSHPPYLARFDFELESSMDIERLASAWNKAATQLGILRTKFVPTETGIAQVVLRSVAASGSIIPNGDIDKAFEDFVAAARQFGDEPPWKVCISNKEIGKPQHMAVFAFHGIYDAISLPLLLNAVCDLYRDPKANVSTAPQFHEISTHNHYISAKDEANFWQQHLGSVSLLGLQEPSTTGTSMHTVRTKIDLPQTPNICANLRVTASAVFHAAWLLTVARAFNCNPTIGVVVSGRMVEIDDADRVIGPMFNTLPRSVTALDTETTLAGLISLCHKKNVETIARQHTSLSQIRKWLSLPTNHDLFDSLFVFQKGPEMQLENSLWTMKSSATIADYPLNVEIEESDHHRFQISISMIGTGYDSEAEKLLKTFIEILSNLQDSLGSVLPSCFTPSNNRISRQDNDYRSEAEMFEDLGSGGPQFAIRRVIAGLAGVEWLQVKQGSPTIFELGLDSVDAVKIASRLKSEGLSIPVSKIIKHPTVAGISQHIVTGGGNANGTSTDTGLSSDNGQTTQAVLNNHFHTDEGELVLNVTPMQAGLLLDSHKYYHTFVYRILDGISTHRLADALTQVVAHIPALRTRIKALDTLLSNEAFTQIIESSSDARVQVTNLNNDDELQFWLRTVQNLRASADSRPLIAVANIADGPSYFVLALHHALYDGMSISLLHQNIQRAYFGKAIQAAPLTAVSEYISDARAAATDDGNNHFWVSQLQGIQPSIVGPIDHDDSAAQMLLLQRASCIPVPRMRQLCKARGITYQSIGLACWSLALAHLTQQLDVCFGLVASGRTTVETQELPFPTFNTVIFRPQLRQGMRKAELLKEIHQLTGDIYEHQLFPLSQAAILAAQPASRLFNTLFTFQKQPARIEDFQPIYEELRSTKEVRQPPYAFNLEMEEVDSKLQWTIAVQQGVRSAEKIGEIFEMLDIVLDNLMADGDAEIVQAVSSKMSICGLQAFEIRPTHNEAEDTRGEASPPELYSNAEQSIRQVFAELSGTTMENITRSTTLFHLGLDSISSMKVSNLLRKAGWRVPVSKILEQQSVAGIANAAEAIQNDVKDSTGQIEPSILVVKAEQQVRDRLRHLEIEDGDIEAVLPASGGQEYMLDMWRASRGCLFHSTFWFEVRNCDEERLRRALEQLAKEIPALRTRFVQYNGRYYQVALHKGSSSRQLVPWSYQMESMSDKLLLSLQMHHALYDGVSLELMLQRLTTLCGGEHGQSDAVVMTDQRAFLRVTTALVSQEKQQQKEFWIRYIGTGQSLMSERGGFAVPRTETFVSDVTSVQPILDKLRQEGISLQAAFLTVAARQWAKTLHLNGEKHSEPRSVWIGVYLNNRTLDIADLSVLACPTFNIVPLKAEVDEDIVAASRQLQQDLIEVSKAAHCGVYLREIYEWTGLKLDCYINFLRLPENDTAPETGSGETAEIDHAQAEAKSMAQALRLPEKISPLFEEATEDEGLEWCLPAMDIEARVEEGGRLGVGVFVPSDMLDAEGVERFVQGLKIELERMSK